jgi:hypothetical protein
MNGLSFRSQIGRAVLKVGCIDDKLRDQRTIVAFTFLLDTRGGAKERNSFWITGIRISSASIFAFVSRLREVNEHP